MIIKVYGSSNCHACDVLKNRIRNEILTNNPEYNNMFAFYDVSSDTMAREELESHGVMSVPLMVFYSNNKPVHYITGCVSTKKVVDAITKFSVPPNSTSH